MLRRWRQGLLGNRLTMSLKNRLRLSIVSLVVIVVIVLAAVHVHSVIGSHFQEASQLASIGADQVESFILQIVDEQTVRYDPPPRTLEEVKKVWMSIIENDAGLAALLQNLMGTSPVIVEILVTGPNDRILTASLPEKRGQKVQARPNFQEFESLAFQEKLRQVLTASRDYEVTKPLGIRGEEEAIFTVRVVLASALIRAQIIPSLQNFAQAAALALLLSLLLAVVASKIAFRPLARIGEIVDRISRGEPSPQKPTSSDESSEVAVVESKLNVLGQQFRGAQADRAKLQATIDQVLERLEEAVLLFGPDDRLVMAGRAAERLLGRRWGLMGTTVDDVFPASTDLGALVQSAVHLNQIVTDRPVTLEREGDPPVRLLVSIEVVEDFLTHERRGTMVTLREAEPRRQIESQLDIATRLASISRLTGGAAHEIKNPLNSISLHLELLKTKLDSASPEAAAEIEVISREITRLDRVVKSFLDFTRPVDLEMERVDLVRLLEDVGGLVRPDAERRGVRLQLEISVKEAPVRGDKDLLTQAFLNVVVNGIDAMPDGGLLQLGIAQSSHDWQISVRDHGVGIPPELHAKIYNLYFTTKGQGSGIGLAMTFRVVQLHGGTIDFQSQPGQGTEFRLRLPAAQVEGADTSTEAARPVPIRAEKAN